MPYILDGRPISPDSAFTHNDIQYPANWIRLSTEEEKADIGMTYEPDPAPYDQRFYWGYDTDGDLIPKDHAQLIEQWTQQTRATANTLLAPTDWIIIREADNGKPADPLIKAWRQDIRLATGSKNELIAATADTAELASYITGLDYNVWPRDPYSPNPVADTSVDGMEPAGDVGTI